MIYFTIVFRRKEENYDPPDIDSSLDDERLFNPFSGSYLTLEEIESGRNLVVQDLRVIHPDVPEHYRSDPYLQAKLKLRELGYESMEDNTPLKDYQLQFFDMNLGLDPGTKLHLNKIYKGHEFTLFLITISYSLPSGYGTEDYDEPQIAASIPLNSIQNNWTVPLDKFIEQAGELELDLIHDRWMKNTILEFKESTVALRVRQVVDTEMIESFVEVIKHLKRVLNI